MGICEQSAAFCSVSALDLVPFGKGGLLQLTVKAMLQSAVPINDTPPHSPPKRT